MDPVRGRGGDETRVNTRKDREAGVGAGARSLWSGARVVRRGTTRARGQSYAQFNGNDVVLCIKDR